MRVQRRQSREHVHIDGMKAWVATEPVAWARAPHRLQLLCQVSVGCGIAHIYIRKGKPHGQRAVVVQVAEQEPCGVAELAQRLAGGGDNLGADQHVLQAHNTVNVGGRQSTQQCSRCLCLPWSSQRSLPRVAQRLRRSQHRTARRASSSSASSFSSSSCSTQTHRRHQQTPTRHLAACRAVQLPRLRLPTRPAASARRPCQG